MKIRYYFAKIFKRLKIDKLYGKFLRSHPKLKQFDKISSDVLKDRYNPERELYASLVSRNEWNVYKEFNLQIIVSVYNGEQYIKSCVESILNQKTEFTWQLIVVNDGSTDSTLSILESFDGCRLRIINQENRGFSGGRNSGLNLMSSDYVLFVDADDLLENNAIESFLTFAFQNNLDIVEGNFFSLNKNKKTRKSFYSNEILSNPISSLRGYPWGKVIKTDLFENIQFPCGYWFEDSIFTFLLYPLSSKCGTISDYVYSYRKNIQGISNKSKQNIKCLDTVYVIEEMLNSANKLGIRFTSEYYEAFLKHVCLCYERMLFMEIEIKAAAFKYLCALHAKYFNDFNTENRILQKVAIALNNEDYRLWSKIALYCNY